MTKQSNNIVSIQQSSDSRIRFYMISMDRKRHRPLWLIKKQHVVEVFPKDPDDAAQHGCGHESRSDRTRNREAPWIREALLRKGLHTKFVCYHGWSPHQLRRYLTRLSAEENYVFWMGAWGKLSFSKRGFPSKPIKIIYSKNQWFYKKQRELYAGDNCSGMDMISIVAFISTAPGWASFSKRSLGKSVEFYFVSSTNM